MANLTDADKILRNDTGKDIALKLDIIAGAIGAEDNTYSKAQSDMRFVKKEDGASGVAFDNSGTELESTNVEDVIKEIDGSLSTVATTGNYDDLNNKPTIPVIDDTTEVNNKVWSSKKTYDEIVNILPTGNASGSIANFKTSLALPMEIVADVNAKQEEGTPTPSSPKEISGVSAVNLVNQNDKADIFRNLLLGNYGFIELNSFNWTRNTFSGIDYFTTTTLVPNVKGIASGQLGNEFTNKYTTIRSNGVTGAFVDKTCFLWTSKVFYVRDDDYSDATAFKNSLSGVYLIYELETPITPTITKAQFDTLLTAFGINGISELINLGGTYYGGQVEVDKDGHRRLKVTFGYGSKALSSYSSKEENANTYKYVFSNATVEIPLRNNKQKCNIAPYGYHTEDTTHFYINTGRNLVIYLPKDLDESTTTIEYIYELETPYYIDLTSGEPITALVGTNNVYADSGDIEVTYKKSIDDAIAELQALILG